MEQQFEALFQRADLDKDGRISGAEAVTFFQGSNLPKSVLAQIWMHSDKNNTGFLGRIEFYNALRLATVAQSGRELTREIIKAALEGPAAARIPPPQINPVGAPVPPVNPLLTPRTQASMMPPTSQNLGIRGPSTQVLPNVAASSQTFTPSVNQFTRPPIQGTAAASSLPMQSVGQGLPGGSVAGPRFPVSAPRSLSTDWFGGRAGGTLGGATQIDRDITLSVNQDGFAPVLSGPTSLVTQRPQTKPVQSASTLPGSFAMSLALSQPSVKDSSALVASGNGLLSGSTSGGDAFSASPIKQNDSSFTFPTSMIPSLSSTVSITTGSQLPVKPAQVNSLPTMTPVVGSGALQQTQSFMKQQTQLDKLPRTTSPASGGGTGASDPNLTQSQTPWPKMTQSNIQKYTKVFVEVDKDRDGKITGEEARNLFLSWRLPREVLKQVWDLSDQDGDSMLSLKEFCVALYLMERYREGRPMPAALPNSLRFDDALVQTTSQPPVAFRNLAWQPNPSFSQQPVPASHPVMSVPVLKPQPKVQMPPQIDSQIESVRQKSSLPVLEKHLLNQLSNEEQNALNSKHKEVTSADEKVQELEKEIMDSKEKIEFYRTKMQDLVLYKSRCDNRLNEIIERASADKREVEVLAKKYEEKYKQTGDVASKLTVEEATFRDIQERKLELYNAIVKMEQGGSPDGLLQVRADRIQSDLEELVKALNDRCKKYALRVKPTALIELPFGWQPGITEGAADWDEDWDKFEDDGFALVKELTADVENVIAPPKSKLSLVSSDKISKDDALFAPSSDTEMKVEKHSSMGDRETERESAYASEDASARSPPSSPPGRSVVESPSEEVDSTQFGMHYASSLHATDNHSDQVAAESSMSGDKYADESSWGATFDTNDDVDSVWGFNPINKESGHERNKQNSFDSGDFVLNPIKIGSPGASSVFGKESSFFGESPSAASVFGKESSFFGESPSASSVFGKEKSSFFDDSVPGTPLFSSGPSPKYNNGLDLSFDSFSRFDSFSTHEGSLARFDSIRSNRDFDSSSVFSQTESLARFDSIRSTRDLDHNRGFTSFDDSDPFGSGPFKSSQNSTSKQASDNWSAF